jgi:hypothetical protein
MGWFESLTALVSRLLSGPRSFTDQIPVEAGGTGLKSAWRSWQEMNYTPDEVGGGLPRSVELSGLNRRITVIFRHYFQEDQLGSRAIKDLALCQRTLAQVVPTLSGNNRQYFAMASSIARGILEASTEPMAGQGQDQTDAS